MAFHIRYSHFEDQIMLFSFSNVSASFQNYINKILAKKLDIFVMIYFDNILVYIEDLDQSYVDIIWWVLEQL